MKNSDLNSKQQSEFKAIVKQLDAKDYKKGLRNAEKLLQSVPDNQEVLSLKGIFLYYTDEQAEGTQVAKTALYKNLNSYFCWHIYGLIHKASKNYTEAVKCFLQSLKLGEENLQLLRDTANIQLHIRDYQGNATSRYQLLNAKSNMTVNWVGFILAMHLTRQYDQAFKAVESTERILAKDVNNTPKAVEINEFKLYQLQLCIDAGDLKKAQQYLIDFKPQITDTLVYNELAFEIYSKLKLKQEALESIQQLITLQPQNWRYYQLLLTLDENADLSQYKNSLVQGRLLVNKKGKDFEDSFKMFVQPFFEKAIPSLIKEISHLYADNDKHATIEETFKQYKNNADPLQHVWALMLLSQHYYKVHNYPEALLNIEEAIKHTPTLHELYIVKAKILKRQSQFKEAYLSADRARQLDLADRYLNNKAIKYALKANLIYVAQDLIKLFLRDGSNPYELQTIWFELGCAQALARLRYFPQALALGSLILKHYQEMYEDQIDFYQYSIRKYTLRSLLQMVNAMDTRYNTKYFVETAGLMLEVLGLFAQTLDAKQDVQVKKLTPAEKKKQAKIQQKIEEEKQLREMYSIEGHIFSVELQKKYDLSGEQLITTLKTKQDIEKLKSEYAKLLIHAHCNNKESNFNAFKHLVQIYINSNKPLLCIKLFNKLKANETQKNQVVNHKYQLLLIRYFANYKGEHQAFVAEVAQNPAQFDADFWKKQQIVSQLDKAIKSQTEKILANLPYEIDEKSDDLDFLVEFPVARLTTMNAFYANDPNKIWQDQQIGLHQQALQIQQ